LLKNKNKRAYR